VAAPTARAQDSDAPADPAPAPDPVTVPALPTLPVGGLPVAQAPEPQRPASPRTRGCDFDAPLTGRPEAPVFPCDFPDPMVLRADGAYYAYATPTKWGHQDRTFPVLASTDLRHWHLLGQALPATPRWASGDVWAPSVLAARGRYFLYYSALRRRDGVHCLAVATASRPAGPFRDHGPIACRDARASGYIDPAAMMDRGRGYLYFSVDGPRHSVSVLTLDRSLLRVRGPRRSLIGPARSWLRSSGTETVEAPWPVRRGRRFYLFYSAGCWCSDYRMGWAVADRPTGPFRLSPRNPMISGQAGLLAPGGGSVVSGPGGTSTLVFHAWTGTPDYDLGGIRTLRTVRLGWGPAGPRPLSGG
jgi:xylan 1,4-beta-xylosidase